MLGLALDAVLVEASVWASDNGQVAVLRWALDWFRALLADRQRAWELR